MMLYENQVVRSTTVNQTNMVSLTIVSVIIKKPVTQSRTLEWSRSTYIKFQTAGPKLSIVHISQHTQLYHEK